MIIVDPHIAHEWGAINESLRKSSPKLVRKILSGELFRKWR